jgi:hypothetical protein
MLSFECFIPISVLRAEPYYHEDANFVLIRMRARSASGWSNYNPPGIGIELPDPTVRAP